MTTQLARRRAILLARRWLSQIADPVRAARGALGFRRYFADWYHYVRLPEAETIHLGDAYPQVHDCTNTTPFDAHYFYANGWAMRRIVAVSPRHHVDIGSQTTFVSLLGAVVPVIFADYRPLRANMAGCHCMCGNLLALPFADYSVPSLSCLHVIEHTGLGRYGDPLDPEGTWTATRELARVLAPGGHLFLATPIGRPRVCFNAHRIYAAETICKMVPELELVEFSGVNDEGHYLERTDLSTFHDNEYACGFFRFTRP